MKPLKRGAIYVTKSPTKLADGAICRYAYLRYDLWDEEKGRPQPVRLASLGRADQLDDNRLADLTGFLRDWLKKDSALPHEALKERFEGLAPTFRILCSKDFGLRFVLEQAWKELGYKEAIEEVTRKRGHEFRVDLAIFCMVMIQAVSPRSKLALSRWAGSEVFLPECAGLTVHQLYKGLDVLEDGYETVQKSLSESLRALGVPTTRLLHDTTSQHFRIRCDDEERFDREEARASRGEVRRAAVINDPPLRLRGHSKSKRGDLPQVVIQAVVGEDHGLVLHHRTHAGNTSDLSLTEEVAGELGKLGYKEIEWVSDAGLNSAVGRESLRLEGFEFVLGEGKSRTQAAKAVILERGRLCKHPEKPHLSYRASLCESTEGKTKRKRLLVLRVNAKKRKEDLARIEEHLERIQEALEKGPHKADELLGHPALKRYVRRSNTKKDKNGKPAGRILLDRAAVAKARREAGKTVISSSIESKSPVEVDEVYRSLYKVESMFRQLKSGVKLGPIRHRKAERIGGHVSIAVMAYNLCAWLQYKTGLSLERLQTTLTPLRVQKVQVGKAEYWERVEMSKEQTDLFAKLGYALPPKRFTVGLFE